jgi:hypothetical protein
MYTEGAAGLSCTEFPFFRGACRQGGGGIVLYMILCEWDAPEGHPGQCCVHLYLLVSYQRLSPQFQFSLSGVTLVYLSQWSCPYTTWNKTASY